MKARSQHQDQNNACTLSSPAGSTRSRRCDQFATQEWYVRDIPDQYHTGTLKSFSLANPRPRAAERSSPRAQFTAIRDINALWTSPYAMGDVILARLAASMESLSVIDELDRVFQ